MEQENVNCEAIVLPLFLNPYNVYFFNSYSLCNASIGDSVSSSVCFIML